LVALHDGTLHEAAIAAAPRPFDLTGRVALVTGSSRGIGNAIAGALARAGAHVVLHGRDAAVLRDAEDTLLSQGLSVSTARFDITDEAATSEGIATVAAEHRRFDILVNNAGVTARAALLDADTDGWRKVIEADLTACFVAAREAGRLMAAAGWGRIINIASVAGLLAAPGRVSYIAAKHGLIGLTRSLALELGPKGVTSNAIAPGFVATELNADMRENASLDQWVKGRNPLGRWGAPADVAGAVVYLASPAAGFVNGAVLAIDGGMSAVV